MFSAICLNNENNNMAGPQAQSNKCGHMPAYPVQRVCELYLSEELHALKACAILTYSLSSWANFTENTGPLQPKMQK